MKKFLFISLLIVLVAGVSLVGCAKQAPAPAPTPTPTPTPTAPIKIGAIMSLTGEDAIVGTGVKTALQYALDQSGGQIAGRKIQLIIEDDATDPTTGIDKAKKLVTFDKIDVLLGPLHGAVGGGVASYMSTIKIPEILFMEKSIGVLQTGSNNIFLPFGTMEGNGYFAGLYAHDKLGYKTATALYEDFVAGQEFTGGEIKAFEKAGGTVIQKQPIAPGAMDFSPNLAAIKQADCVLFWFTPMVCQRFVSQYYAAGLKMPLILGLHTVLFPPLLAEIGDKSVGIVGAGTYTSTLDTPINKSYVEGMISKYKTVPTAEVITAEVAWDMYLAAVKATNGDTSSAKIIDALHKIKVDTPAGTYSFTPEGLGIGDLYIMHVVKLPDRYDWVVIDKYSQIPLDIPK